MMSQDAIVTRLIIEDQVATMKALKALLKAGEIAFAIESIEEIEALYESCKIDSLPPTHEGNVVDINRRV